MRYAANYSGDFSGNSLISENREQLVKEAIGEFGEAFFICECVEFTPTVHADDILNCIAEQATDHGGEHAEGFDQEIASIECSDLEKKLQQVVMSWLEEKKLLPTSFFQVGKIWLYEMIHDEMKCRELEANDDNKTSIVQISLV